MNWRGFLRDIFHAVRLCWRQWRRDTDVVLVYLFVPGPEARDMPSDELARRTGESVVRHLRGVK